MRTPSVLERINPAFRFQINFVANTFHSFFLPTPRPRFLDLVNKLVFTCELLGEYWYISQRVLLAIKI